jgi:hypothetical protein
MMTQSPSNIALRAVLALAGVAIIFLGLNVGLGGADLGLARLNRVSDGYRCTSI